MRQVYLSNTAFAIFFYAADTDGDASVSLSAREAHFHMTLHAAIGGTGASQSFYFAGMMCFYLGRDSRI